jgi:phospholipid N-methyltransferase
VAVGRFIREFLRRPGSIGAVVPSSSELSDLITDTAGVADADVVVEIGPGTGPFTEAILRKLKPGATFFAIEFNEPFVKLLRQKFPGASIHHDSAVNICPLLKSHGHTTCNAVVSGLPFASFADGMQDEVLRAVRDALVPGGVFATFAYWQGLMVPQGLRFRRRLHDEFSQVTTTKTVWGNVPPAFVYRAVK